MHIQSKIFSPVHAEMCYNKGESHHNSIFSTFIQVFQWMATSYALHMTGHPALCQLGESDPAKARATALQNTWAEAQLGNDQLSPLVVTH